MKFNLPFLLPVALCFTLLIQIGTCFRSREDVFDLCVIGAGMFGSAAAKHASANPGIKVCLIGPDEPKDEEERAKRDIFGAYYDEARIVDTIEPDAEIQVLSRESMKAYRELEKLSGISFYHPVGQLTIGKQWSRWMERGQRGASSRTKDCVLDLSNRTLFENRFPFIRIPDDYYGILDDTGAGYINPRKMVAAQIEVARKQGCTVFKSVVREVSEKEGGSQKIIMDDGSFVYAKRVLFATGAFTNFKKFNTLPKLQLTPIRETVALLRIPPDEYQRINAMPCILYRREEDGFMAYILPPVLYPDGFYYLKIGSMNVDFRTQAIHSLQGIKDWYLGQGDRRKVHSTSEFLIDMLPGIAVDHIKSATCATSASPSSLPYIDRISPTVTVALAGNGRGAKICEEVGRIAAHLSLTGQWASKTPQRSFQAIPVT